MHSIRMDTCDARTPVVGLGEPFKTTRYGQAPRSPSYRQPSRHWRPNAKAAATSRNSATSAKQRPSSSGSRSKGSAGLHNDFSRKVATEDPQDESTQFCCGVRAAADDKYSRGGVAAAPFFAGDAAQALINMSAKAPLVKLMVQYNVVDRVMVCACLLCTGAWQQRCDTVEPSLGHDMWAAVLTHQRPCACESPPLPTAYALTWPLSKPDGTVFLRPGLGPETRRRRGEEGGGRGGGGGLCSEESLP